MVKKEDLEESYKKELQGIMMRLQDRKDDKLGSGHGTDHGLAISQLTK